MYHLNSDCKPFWSAQEQASGNGILIETNSPAGYGALASAGLAVFLASLWALRRTVADATDKYHSAGLRLFGIVMALVVLAVHPLVPSIVSNGLWVLALFSQIGVPIFLALRDVRRSDKML